jgi:uncharacterized membrane protein
MTKIVHEHVDHPLERLMFFSDAVFAIAITLLVIEIKVPHLASASPDAALRALLGLLPSFIAYVLSFLVIGRFWMFHHGVLGLMTHCAPRLLWPNLVLLMSVAFMPFAAAFYAENSFQIVPNVFYDLAMFALGVCSAWVASIATAPENVRVAIDARTRATMKARGHGVIVTTLIALVGSFVVAGPSQALLSLIPVMQKLLVRLYTRGIPAS